MLASPDEDASSSETSHTAQNGQATDRCDCPEQVVPRKTFKATFTRLDHNEKYFPMISRGEPQAFFGLAPAAVRPTALVRSPPASPIHIRRSSPAKNALSTNQQHGRDTLNGGQEDLYDASSNDGREFMDIDTPHPSPSTHTLVTESESDPDGRGDNVQSRSASPVNPPQVRRRPVTIRVRVRNNSKLAFNLVVMIHFYSQAQNNDQLQRAKDTIANIYEELDSINATLESLRDEASRLSVSKHANSEEVEDT
jgi:hypothetical protein